MSRHTKKITGLILIIIGALALIISLYARGRVSEIKGEINKGSSLFSKNPINKQISGSMVKQASAYDTRIMWGMIGGVVLIVVGAGTIVLSRRR